MSTFDCTASDSSWILIFLSIIKETLGAVWRDYGGKEDGRKPTDWSFPERAWGQEISLYRIMASRPVNVRRLFFWGRGVGVAI